MASGFLIWILRVFRGSMSFWWCSHPLEARWNLQTSTWCRSSRAWTPRYWGFFDRRDWTLQRRFFIRIPSRIPSFLWISICVLLLFVSTLQVPPHRQDWINWVLIPSLNCAALVRYPKIVRKDHWDSSPCRNRTDCDTSQRCFRTVSGWSTRKVPKTACTLFANVSRHWHGRFPSCF